MRHTLFAAIYQLTAITGAKEASYSDQTVRSHSFNWVPTVDGTYVVCQSSQRWLGINLLCN